MEGWVLLRTLLLLFGFLTVLVIAAYGIRRWALGGASRGSIPFSIVARLPLPPKAMVYAVQVGEKVFLLGVTEHTVTMLREYTVDEWEAHVPTAVASHPVIHLLQSRRSPSSP